MAIIDRSNLTNRYDVMPELYWCAVGWKSSGDKSIILILPGNCTGGDVSWLSADARLLEHDVQPPTILFEEFFPRALPSLIAGREEK